MKHSKLRRNICLIIAILLILGFIVPVLISSAALPQQAMATAAFTGVGSLGGQAL